MADSSLPPSSPPSLVAALRSVRGWAIAALVISLLVITAGATVRATGSGMGCPDWPRCFGQLIPPISASEVTWAADLPVRAGEMIIHPDASGTPRLLVAQQSFTTGRTFDASQWRAYEVHDYAVFNPVHTWIEFTNRLLGAITSIPVLGLLVMAIIAGWRGYGWQPTAAALGCVVLLGVIAWLGRMVVADHLAPGTITIHMAMACALVAALVGCSSFGLPRSAATPSLWWGLVATTVLVAGQIVLGTQVREAVDTLNAATPPIPRAAWWEALPSLAEWHRSLSWLLLGTLGTWLIAAWRHGWARWWILSCGGLLVFQILLGVIMSWFAFPSVTQPLHLVGAVILLALLLRGLARHRPQVSIERAATAESAAHHAAG